MKSRAIAACLFVALIAGGIWMVLDSNSPLDKPSAIARACALGQPEPAACSQQCGSGGNQGQHFQPRVPPSFHRKKKRWHDLA
ncbi:hypothetical protein [Prosthecobacter sp.]|uniref:hypothetical protein n=1 Tax=Prosthecobacter sp. TaxID=1965333 RepID=UPI0037843F4E